MSSSNNVKEFIKDSGDGVEDIHPDEGDSDEIVKRAKLLLRYHKRAKELITALNIELQGRPGSKRSKEFEDFIVTNRDYLKTQLRLCEPAVQRILLYSNNFLYKASATASKISATASNTSSTVSKISATVSNTSATASKI